MGRAGERIVEGASMMRTSMNHLISACRNFRS
jgi:hypothetical protein